VGAAAALLGSLGRRSTLFETGEIGVNVGLGRFSVVYPFDGRHSFPYNCPTCGAKALAFASPDRFCPRFLQERSHMTLSLINEPTHAIA